MRGNAGAGRVGAGGARRRRSRLRRLRRTSAGSSRRSSATSTACTRCRPASTSTSSRRSARDEALAACSRRRARDPPNPGNAKERLPDEGNADRLAAFLAADEPTVVYFGKLLRNKGVHLLLEALRELEARAVIVGFGDYRAELEAPAPPSDALHRRRSSTGTSSTCSPLADVAVVPSIFPEAFGMVAAEAAAAGCPPLVARHSGLAEIAAGLEEEYPPSAAHLAQLRDRRRRRPARRSSSELLALAPRRARGPRRGSAHARP